MILILFPHIVFFHNKFLDLLLGTSYIFKPITASWSGYMSSIAKTQNKEKSVLSMLPMINLHATDSTALYSLLLFLEKQFQKLGSGILVVTFDQ